MEVLRGIALWVMWVGLKWRQLRGGFGCGLWWGEWRVCAGNEWVALCSICYTKVWLKICLGVGSLSLHVEALPDAPSKFLPESSLSLYLSILLDQLLVIASNLVCSL